MAKRLTQKQKEKIIQSFLKGKSIDILSQEFDCSKLTIIRNVKKDIGESRYKLLLKKNQNVKHNPEKKNINNIENVSFESSKNQNYEFHDFNKERSDFDNFQETSFFEIAPIDYDIDNSVRKELSSVPISEIDFPKIVYMIVDKNIELEIKLLKDYPEWSFLPVEELNRKTIEIFLDLKSAKRFCTKEQKVIKVPNTNVFKIVAPLLISRGISRIVSSEQLIAL